MKQSMQRAEHEQWNSTEVARLLALVETERRYYQDIFAALPVAIALVDSEWRLVAVNREFRRRFSLQQSDIARLRLPDLIPAPELEAAMASALETARPVAGLKVAVGEMGLRISIQRLPGWQAGSDDELLITFDDAGIERESIEPPSGETGISEAEVEARVESSKRAAMERLSGRLAHVANNLLMIIGGYGEELKASLGEADERRGDVDEILKAAARLGALTKDLTSLTRPPTFEAVEFGVARWMAATAGRLKGLRVDAGEAPRDLAAHTSPLLLEQLVYEAARYVQPLLGEQDRLRLDARAGEAGRLEITVTGLHLTPEARERFFEPFAGEKVGTDPPLGLAGLVRPWENLGGRLRLADSSLVIECPRAEAAPKQAAARLLLVEDEAGIRSLVAKALERQGYEVMQAAAPADALRICEELMFAPDAVVTDLMVPGMSGGELAERLRAQWPELKVLFISGYTADRNLSEQIASGTLPERTRFLAKPFTTAQLGAEIKSLLDIQ